MTLTLYNSGKDSRIGAMDFAIRRVVRIFPLYLLVFFALFIAAASAGVGGPEGFEPTLTNFVWNALLLPRDDLTTYMPVSAWTLTHELMFYTICIVGFFSKRLFWFLLGLWSAACLIYFVWEGSIKNLAMLLSPLNIYFLLGVLCAALFRVHKDTNSMLWLSTGFIMLTCAILVETAVFSAGQRTIYDAILYAISFFALTFAMATLKTSNQSLLARVMDYFGKISYALYLLNFPIIVAVAMIVARFETGLIGQIIFVLISISASLIASTLSFKLIESPGIAIGRMVANKVTSRATSATAPV
jgi:exopolysaccharide production protein ExoZ